MLSRCCLSTRLLCRKLEFHSPVCTQVASLMRLEHPPNYDHVEFPEKRKLKFFDKVPKLPTDQRPQKMMKDLALMRGPELIHNKLQYAEFGIQAVQGGRLRHGQIEAVRGIMYRNIDEKRMFSIWRIDQPWQAVTKKGQGKRMGGGKGSIDRYEFPVRPDRIILEVGGTVEFQEVRKFMEQAAHILPFKARVVTKEMLMKEKEEEERIKRENMNPFTFEYCAKRNFLGMNVWLSPYDYRWHNKYR
ncbi:hypothetical protein ACJMK2_008458 [Sinanodonta woodiana]|uniref:Large ribosomal subunit protein uL16m n=1 Tax=Sinanodonta woodiana TaxID=1069815 RepID=A0ABD3VPN3_SINWO